jgi:hypothetical protein
LISGKRRNGPTKTTDIAHRLHLSRFTNTAKSQAAAARRRCLLKLIFSSGVA